MQKPTRRNQQRKRQPNQGSRLKTFRRRFHLHKEVNFSGWTNLGAAHLRSLNQTLSFNAASLPGWSSISQNWDQFRINKITYKFVNDSVLGSTGLDAGARIYNLLSAYDPDGGTESSIDILSRNNLTIHTLGYGSSNICYLSCVPGYKTTDGEVRKNAWIDQSSASLEFYTFQCVVDTLKSGVTTGEILPFAVYVTVDFEFRGAR
jgi:hypothetical protein